MSIACTRSHVSEVLATLDGPLIIIPVGLPGAGKSSTAEVIQASGRLRDLVVISADALVKEFSERHGIPFEAASERFHDAIKQRARQDIEDALARGRSIFIDRPNETRASRWEYLEGLELRCRAAGYRFVALQLERRLDDAIRHVKQRAAEGGHKVSEATVRRMAASFEPPRHGEFDVIVRVTKR